MKKINKFLYAPSTHLEFFSLLLVITPFLMLQNYLQTAILLITRLSFSIGNLNIPYVPLVVISVVLAVVFTQWKRIKLMHIYAWFFILLLIAFCHQTTDYYLNNKFYDLQINWHYIAYGLFAFMAYRVFKPKGVPSERIILYTIVLALSISTFDEGIQVFISNRIFDICDIAKDLIGVGIGLILIAFCLENGKIIKNGWRIRHRKISDYWQNSLSLLFLELVFAIIILLISSILTNLIYWGIIVLTTFVIFIVFFLFFHFSQWKIIRRSSICVAVLVLILQGFFFIKYHDQNIVYNSYGWTVYKGIPIPFFDIMIYPNGTFRLVDKKLDFNRRDKLTIFEHANDILLIGSGHKGEGGNGFPEKTEMQFVFNQLKQQGLQIIILTTPQACREYNRLKQNGFDVLFIINNT